MGSIQLHLIVFHFSLFQHFLETNDFLALFPVATLGPMMLLAMDAAVAASPASFAQLARVSRQSNAAMGAAASQITQFQDETRMLGFPKRFLGKVKATSFGNTHPELCLRHELESFTTQHRKTHHCPCQLHVA